jgi:glycogen(starch) synthase
MKILMTADTIGGVWTYALDLATALAPHGVEIHLATMGDPLSPDQQRDADERPNVTIHESTYKLEWMNDPWQDVKAAGRWLLDLEQQIAADIIHLNGYAHGSLPFRAPIVVVAHSCVLSWWRAVKGEPAPESWNTYQREVRAGIHDADVIVAPTAAMLAAIEENYGGLRRTAVIPNGRDSSLYHAGERELFILTAGRLWDEAKNLQVLQSIAPRLSCPVYVAGECTSPDGNGHTVGNAIRSLGKLPPADLASWFSRAAIYALPARYEPFGLSALEAALSGCALVLGDIPSLREVWGDTALFVSPNDAEALRRAIQLLIEHPKQRQSLADRARERAVNYTLTRMGNAYQHLYRTTLNRLRHFELDARIANSFVTASAEGRI